MWLKWKLTASATSVERLELLEMTDSAKLRALVTGGASGIGLATVQALNVSGMTVAVLDLAENDTHGFIHVSADVRNDASVQAGVASALSQLGGLDVLVNCAGTGAKGGVCDNDDDEWHKVFDVNVVGMVRVIRAALPALLQSPAASIVNVSSIAATVGLPDRVLYSATKGAVLSMTLAMAADLLTGGIRVNAVNPGTTDTPWVARLLESAADPTAERVALQNRQPHGRLVSADEVAGAIAYLASPSSGSTTGTYLAVDGGMQRIRVGPRS